MMNTNDQPWYTYIVSCNDQTLYTGITNNLDKRIDAHNSGVGAKYTRSRRPIRLLYSEKHESRSAAAKREYQLKKLPPAEKRKIISEQK
ncbi:GIY-YIG nuclease family protein [Thermodesulfobacteriota bacterium]